MRFSWSVRWLLGITVVAGLGLVFGNDGLRLLESSETSRSVGSPGRGHLEHGKRMPTRGANFTSYSMLGALMGRTGVHGEVREILVAAWAALAETQPEVTWVLGESGWPRGGPFWPHKSHQNGLAVDHMVPVRAATGEVERLPCWPWNEWGYGIDFDAEGLGPGIQIDFEALSALIGAVDAAARVRGARLSLVIFAPELQGKLDPKLRVPFSTKPAWIRHDEHVHFVFTL